MSECFVEIDRFEIKILDFIRNNLSCPFLDTFFKNYTQFGGVMFMVALSAVLLMIKKTRKTGLNTALALIIGIIVSNLIIKNIFDRVRPYDFNKAVKLIVPPEKDSSFPSGHSMSSFAVAVSVWLHNKKIGAAVFCFAALIAFSRVYIYVHYPSDVLVGIFIGVMSAIVGKYLSDKISEKYPKLF